MSARQQLSVHRAAARLAGRELRRRPWRTALVVLLVALPVAAMVLAASLLRTTKPSFDLEDRSRFGLADVVPQRYGPPGEPVEDIEQVRRRVLAVAPGARMAEVEEVSGAVQGPSGKDRFITLVRAAEDPIVAPRTTVRSGRLPRDPGEVAISPQLARGWRGWPPPPGHHQAGR